MPDRILTSHAGSLPRPEDLIALNEQRAEGNFSNEAEYLGRLRAAVADAVARQRDTGIDLVNDGEFGHSMGQRYDFGSWWTYVFQRLTNVELTDQSIAEIPQPAAKPGEIRLAALGEGPGWAEVAGGSPATAPGGPGG